MIKRIGDTINDVISSRKPINIAIKGSLALPCGRARVNTITGMNTIICPIIDITLTIS